MPLAEEVALLTGPVDDFLVKRGITPHLNDVLALLLENRPTDPLAFVADYFKGVVEGSSGLMRSYRYVRLSRHNCLSFMDNLYAAFLAANGSGTSAASGLTAEAYARLLRALCRDMPAHIVPYVFSVLQKSSSETLTFPEFASGIHACLLYDEFFQLAKQAFTDLAVASGQEVGSSASALSQVAVPLRMAKPKLEHLVHTLAGRGIRTPQLAEVERKLSDGLALGQGPKASKTGRVSFNDFQVAVYRLSLPERPELREVTEVALKVAGSEAPSTSLGTAGSSPGRTSGSSPGRARVAFGGRRR